MAFKDDLKKYVDLAVDKSKLAFGKGRAAVTKFGDDSATRIEKLQLEKKLSKEIMTLGKNVLQTLVTDGKKTISSSDELIGASLRTIAEIKAEIAKKEELLKKEVPATEEAAATAETAEPEKSEKKDENSSKKDD